MKNEVKPQHTQGEWKVNIDEPQIDIVDVGGKQIAILVYDSFPVGDRTTIETQANAQRIVKAVNMHDEMVEHMRKLNDEFVYALTNMAKILKMNMSVESLRIEENTLVKKSKQLLKQAEGK